MPPGGASPTGSTVVVRSTHTSYPWFVGVILLEGPRAGEYATADLIVEDDPPSMRFEGHSAFAATLGETEVAAALDRATRRQADLAMLRVPAAPSDGAPVFDDPQISVLDRPLREADALPDSMFEHAPVDRRSARLALEYEDHRVYLARGVKEDTLFLIDEHSGGGGASGSSLSGLATYGLTYRMSTSSSFPGAVVYGAVPDAVIAVRVDDVHAVMGENAFVAVMPDGPPMHAITLTTRDGNVEVPLRSPLESS